MPNSTTTARSAKPHPDFPLSVHPTGRWFKKVKGRFHYFGKVADDPKGEKALAEWLDQEDDLLAGRTPRPKSGEMTIRELCDRFMVSKRAMMDTGELSPRSFGDYFATCRNILAQFGKTRTVDDLIPSDFEKLRAALAKGKSPVTLGNDIQRVRVVFNYAKDFKLHVDFGSQFKRPAKKVLRRNRRQRTSENGKRMFDAAELRTIIDAASVPLKAMILLGANCGLGNSDCANLCFANLDLKGGWLNYPRPKTEVDRRCPLWSETAEALEAAIKDRPAHDDPANAELVFITRCGGRWGTVRLLEADPDNGRKEATVTVDDPIGKEFTKVLTILKLKRWGVSFYALRHTFETIGGGCRDQVAVDSIMGHESGMSAEYREEVLDDRLRAVTDYVHAWLFPPEKKSSEKA